MNIKGMTPEQMRQKAIEMEMSLPLAKGPEDEKAVKKLINHLRYQADFKESGGLNRAQQKAKAAGLPIPAKGEKKAAKPRKAKAKATTTSDPTQGLLPNFTGVVVPRADEIARDLVFKTLQARVDAEVAKVIELFKKQG